MFGRGAITLVFLFVASGMSAQLPQGRTHFIADLAHIDLFGNTVAQDHINVTLLWRKVPGPQLPPTENDGLSTKLECSSGLEPDPKARIRVTNGTLSVVSRS